jgi:hypothetical protein
MKPWFIKISMALLGALAGLSAAILLLYVYLLVHEVWFR